MEPEAAEIIERILREAEARGVTTLEELSALMAEAGAAYNRAPQADLQWLSPAQVYRLIHMTWSEPDPAIVIRDDLDLADLQCSPLLHDARLFLDLLKSHESTKATPAGNLNRAFTAEMASGIYRRAELERRLVYGGLTLNESDVPDIQRLRWVLMLGRLIRRVHGRFTATRKGARLLAPERAGELCAMLVHTVLRKLNLAVFLWLDIDAAPLQWTIGYTLKVLSGLSEGWHDVSAISETLVLPAVRETLPPDGPSHLRVCIIRSVLVAPLCWIGVLEMSTDRYPAPELVRKTPLFDRLIQFHLDVPVPIIHRSDRA